MGEQLQKLLKPFRQFWEAQDKRRRTLYVAILIAVILLALVIAIILNKKDYVVLYEGLEIAEASEIAAEIQNLGYDVSLKSGGEITVLKGTENTLAMEMTMLGYPRGSGSLDYNIYTDNVGMFTTSAENAQYSRMALESRLSAIVGAFEGVSKATVTLAIPEQRDTVITTYRQNPSASVAVHLERNRSLTNDQIIGITNVIKNAVPGLGAESISIVDGYGVPQIAGETSIDVVADITRKLAFKTQLENSIKDKVLDLLTPGYSAENVSVAVNVDLNFDSKASETFDYKPEGETNNGVLQHADGSNASGGTTVDGGVAGVQDNAEDTYPTGDTNGTGAWEEDSFSNTYLVDTYKEQVQKSGYSVDWMSIGVMLYTDYVADTTKIELASLIANAAGIKPEVAADVVSITNLAKFGEVDFVETQAPTYMFGLTFNQLLVAGAILLILLLVLFVFLAISASSTKRKRAVFERKLIESAGAVDEEAINSGFIISADGNPIEVPSLTDDSVETKEIVIRREIGEFAKTSPDIVAQLLRNWIKDDDD